MTYVIVTFVPPLFFACQSEVFFICAIHNPAVLGSKYCTSFKHCELACLEDPKVPYTAFWSFTHYIVANAALGQTNRSEAAQHWCSLTVA